MLNKFKILVMMVINIFIGYQIYAQCPISTVIIPNDSIIGQNIVTFRSNYFGIQSGYRLPSNKSVTGYSWTLNGTGGDFMPTVGNTSQSTFLLFTTTGVFTLTGTIYSNCRYQTFTKKITVNPYCPTLSSTNSISGAEIVSPSTSTSFYTLKINTINDNYIAYWFDTKWFVNSPATIVSTIGYGDNSYIRFPTTGIYTISTTSTNRCNQTFNFTFQVKAGTITTLTDNIIDYGIYYDNGILKSNSDIDWVISNELGDIMDSRRSNEFDLRTYRGLVLVRTRYKTFKFFISNQ